MKLTRKILIAILLCLPMVAWGDDFDLSAHLNKMNNSETQDQLTNSTIDAFAELQKHYTQKIDKNTVEQIIDTYVKQTGVLGNKPSDTKTNSKTNNAKTPEQSTKEKAAVQKKIDDAKAKLDKAKETEQSTANRMLGGLSTAATGIGGMQLAQGIAEKQADSAADKDMATYIATMKCTYGDGKSVPFSTEPIELPGGNNADLMKYRAEYFKLAADLKERKTALDMKPGIESEEILDKATMGLYDDENKGVTGGAYASRYRAAEGSEQDQKGLSSDKKEARNRMIAGGVVGGVGVIGGIVGNSIINGKLGELIKESKANKAKSKDHNSAVKALKQELKAKNYTNVDSLDFSNIDLSGMKNADWSKIPVATKGNTDATKLISLGNKNSFVSSMQNNLGVKGTED